jgi:hypothetical protein
MALARCHVCSQGLVKTDRVWRNVVPITAAKKRGGGHRHPAQAQTPGDPLDHQTFTFQVADAPGEREIMAVLAAADGGRPLGGLAPLATTSA